MKKTLFLLAIFLGAFLALSRVTRAPDRHPVPANDGEPSTQADITDSAPIGPTFPGYRWSTGKSACWDLQASLRVSDPADAGSTNGPGTSVGGRLHLRVERVAEDVIELLGAMTDVAVSGPNSELLQPLFGSVPCRLRLQPDGKLLGLDFPPEVAESDRRMLQMAYGWEFVARPAAEYSDHDFADTDQRLESHYSRSGGLLIKRRMAAAAEADGLPGQRVLASRFTATVDEGLWVNRATGYESCEFLLDGQELMRAEVWLELHRVDQPFPALAQAVFTTAPAAQANPSVADMARREQLIERWRGVSFDQVVGPLRALTTGSEYPEMAAVSPLLHDLREWIEVNGGEGVLGALKSAGTFEAAALVHALSTTSTPEARAAHREILENPSDYPGEAVHQALVASGLADAREIEAEALDRALLRAVDNLEHDPLNVGLLAEAQRARESEQVRDHLRARAVEGIAQGRAEEVVAPHLLALKEARIFEPETLERARHWLASGSAEVRRLAIQYLAASSPEVRTELQAAYGNDPDELVRAVLNDSP